MTTPTSTDKFRSLFLALLMVLSVVSGTIAFAGTAAANAPNQGAYAAGNASADMTEDADTTTNSRVIVTDLQFAQTGNVDNITVNPGGGASAADISATDIAEIEVIAGLTNGEVVERNTTSVNSLPTEFDFSGSTTANGDQVQNVTVVVEVSESAAQGDAFDNTITITAPDGTTFEGNSPYDTAGVQTVTSNNGFIAGDVTDSSTSESLDDVEIQIFEDTNNNGVVDSSDFLVTTVDTNQNGRYTATLAPGTDYLVEADRAGFQTAASDGTVSVTQGDATTVDIVLTPESVVNNVDVTADPASATVPADGQTEIVYTVNVSGQTGTQTNVGIPGRTVELNLTNGAGPVTVVDSNGDTSTGVSTSGGTVTATTNNTGIAVFNVSSDTVQTVDLTFEETISGENDTATARFEELINDGPGSVRGDISNEETGESIEGASVYAIQSQRFSENTQSVGPITISNFDSSDQTVSFRLINDDTGEVVDADQYRVVKTDSDDRLVKSYPLNESDSAAGNGFVYTDLGGDDDASFNITPLRSANYTLDVAPGSPASNIGFENTANVTTFSSSDAPLDLTQSDIESRYSGTNAIVSNETDARGEYTLTQLFIGQNQNGLDYVVTATDNDFTRDFVDTEVTDNDPAQALIDIEPREPLPASQVNITNLARIPSGEVDGERVSFNDTRDDTAQEVPRDGRTLDVILVETSNVDGAANGTVTLTVENDQFDVSEGGFDESLVNGAESANVVNNGRSITVTTGEDGTATVFLQSDQDSSSLDSTSAEEFVGISSSLVGATGSTATDQTSKSFTGVTRFEVAQMRGDVTNGEDEPLENTLVFTDRFDFGSEVAFSGQEQFRIDLEPADTTSSAEDIEVNSFNVSLFEFNATTSQYELVNTETVATDRLEGNYTFSEFNDISFNASSPGATLVTGTGDDNSYSLPRVPALAGEDVTYQMGAIKTVAPQLGETGTSNEESVQIATTGTADILVRGAQPTQPAFFEVSDLNPQDVTVTQGDSITITATVENTGDLTANQTVEFRVGGNAVASQPVELSGGENTTVTFENVSTASLDSGSYTHGVYTEDSSQTATLTVESSGNNGGNGETSFQDVLVTIQDYNNGNASFQEVLQTIADYNADN
ncbi:hypothetical protein DU500_07370 [Haloplanus rubicundus]|uniref:CARDB domain-containing protein n=1 Tax=Haloplanus rubicundus TaxID=1547898 RepID=A0A345E7A0_9EURY|nr:surface glycoprotein [Haloplanus rubicundus]AXG08072.1 hypothetical protein DU500_07370 [Haloplanus rubicundus]